MDENEKYLQYKALINLAIKNLHIYWKTEDEFREYDDAGVDGIIKGIRTYDPSKKVKESTYVYKCIETELKRRIYLNTMKKRNVEVISLNKTVGVEEAEELIDLIPDDTDIEKLIEDKETSERLINLVDHLPIPKDRYVIKMMYGLDGWEQMSASEIARRWGVNKNSIIQRKNRAIRLLWIKIRNGGL